MLFAGVRARALSGSTPDYPDDEHETLCGCLCLCVYSSSTIPLRANEMNFELYVRAAQTQRCPERMKNEWNKWKNHFYEMKGDVGMSLHEKERNKKMPTPRHKVTHNPIPTSLFLPRTFSCKQLDVKMLCCLLCLMHS